ncbi:hypothetical protein PPM_2773 [Paenibacillus polymyxa M1]|nr:hypothetical protein PPM_2773 [Paenibacillus polymyxa M1]
MKAYSRHGGLAVTAFYKLLITTVEQREIVALLFVREAFPQPHQSIITRQMGIYFLLFAKLNQDNFLNLYD